MLEKLAESLLSQGPLGVIVIGLAYAYWMREKYFDKVQQQRVDDAMKLRDATHAMSDALNRNTETLKSFVEE